MATFVVYQKIAPDKLRAMAQEAITGIEAFFAANPRRKICKATLWNAIRFLVGMSQPPSIGC